MNEEILKAIANALPSMQMEALRAELKKASEYDNLCKAVNQLKDDNAKLKMELDKYKAIESQMQTAIRESNDIKNSFEKKRSDIELQCANSRIGDLKELMNAAFRNPTIHKSFNRHVPVPSNGYTNLVTELETTAVE